MTILPSKLFCRQDGSSRRCRMRLEQSRRPSCLTYLTISLSRVLIMGLRSLHGTKQQSSSERQNVSSTVKKSHENLWECPTTNRETQLGHTNRLAPCKWAQMSNFPPKTQRHVLTLPHSLFLKITTLTLFRRLIKKNWDIKGIETKLGSISSPKTSNDLIKTKSLPKSPSSTSGERKSDCRCKRSESLSEISKN